MLRAAGDRRGLSYLCRVGRPSRRRREMGRKEHMTLSRQWKTLSIRVLHFPDRMIGRLLEDVSFEEPCNARQSLNILLDGLADGAGEAARRRPKSLFHDFCVMMGLDESVKILAQKSSSLFTSLAVPSGFR